MQKMKLSFLIILLLAGSTFIVAQSVVKLKPYDGTAESFIIAQIRADTTANPGILSTNRVYELENGGVYLCTEILTLNGNKNTLRLRTPDGAKAIIYLYPTGTGSNPTRPPGNFVVLNGANIEFTNIAIAGIFEPTPTEITNIQGGLVNTTGVGSRIIIDNCLLTNVNGQHIRTGSGSKLVKVINSTFANMGSLTTSNFGAGKGIDLREVSCDSLILTNDTFVNSQDRIVRHLNLAAGNTVTGILNYCFIDHNTFVNGMGFHGLLSLGNVGKNVQITNNLFVDAYALGQDSLDLVRDVEFNNTGETYANGNPYMPWIFTAPNDTTVWVVKSNYYRITPAGQDFFTTNPRHSEGSPLSAHIKSRLGAFANQAFSKVSDLNLTNSPALMTKLMNYYISPSGGNYTKTVTNYSYLVNDMDRRTYKYFTDSMDCRYNTSSLAYTGSTTGGRVGSLYWWNGKKPVSVESENNIIPTEYSLSQNYPNPFNPTTMIQFSIPKTGVYSLKIYNLLGQEIANLLSGELTVGIYKTDFDASKLSSGVYIYRLSGPNVSIAKKMVLMK